MAKNIDVIQAFIDGASRPKTNNLRIEGNKLVNYGTVIAERYDEGDFDFIVNATKYSMSTTRIQNALINAIEDNGLVEYTKVVIGIKMGADSLI